MLLESDVNPVMLKLIADGLEVTAVHNHLLRANPATFYLHVGGLGDPINPRLFFLHFWANDDAVKLANGLRAALDKTASTKS